MRKTVPVKDVRQGEVANEAVAVVQVRAVRVQEESEGAHGGNHRPVGQLHALGSGGGRPGPACMGVWEGRRTARALHPWLPAAGWRVADGGRQGVAEGSGRDWRRGAAVWGGGGGERHRGVAWRVAGRAARGEARGSNPKGRKKQREEQRGWKERCRGRQAAARAQAGAATGHRCVPVAGRRGSSRLAPALRRCQAAPPHPGRPAWSQ